MREGEGDICSIVCLCMCVWAGTCIHVSICGGPRWMLGCLPQ